jgi:RNA polymerase sigma-70 factor (ECF subfamily)
MPPLHVPDDLLDACRAGSREAFGRLFDVCGDRVFAIAMGVTGDRTVAADVTQDVFVKLLTRIGEFDRRAQFVTWLYRIAVNTAIDHQRQGQRVVTLSEDIPGRENLEDDYARAERRRQVTCAVQALPPKLRTALVLRHIEGLRYTEIAAVLGVSMGTVASRLARAHAQLARRLEGQW